MIHHSNLGYQFYASNPHFHEGKEQLNKKVQLVKNLFLISISKNNKNKKGLDFFIEKEVITNDPKGIGKFLFICRSEFDAEKVSDYITSENNKEILYEYIAQVDYCDLDIDIALSRLLIHMKLPGEAQRIDR